jgi:hypothetical protein
MIEQSHDYLIDLFLFFQLIKKHLIIFLRIKNKRITLKSTIFTKVIHTDYREIAKNIFTPTTWTSTNFHNPPFVPNNLFLNINIFGGFNKKISDYLQVEGFIYLNPEPPQDEQISFPDPLQCEQVSSPEPLQYEQVSFPEPLQYEQVCFPEPLHIIQSSFPEPPQLKQVSLIYLPLFLQFNNKLLLKPFWRF